MDGSSSTVERQDTTPVSSVNVDGSASTVAGQDTSPVSSVHVDGSSSTVEGQDTTPVSSVNVDGSEAVAEAMKVLVDAVMTHVENKGSLSNTFGMPEHETPAQSHEGGQARSENRGAPVTSEQANRTSSTSDRPSVAMSLAELHQQMTLLKTFEKELKKEKKAEAEREQSMVKELKQKLFQAKEEAKNVRLKRQRRHWLLLLQPPPKTHMIFYQI